LLDGIDEDAVDFRATYDGQEEEPVVLPAAFPNLLANGAFGVAVGMATSIPPHEAGELCDELTILIDRPDATTADLMAAAPGPDFPTGGILVESPETIRTAYETGRGSFRLRARWTKEDLKGGTYRIVVTEIPYQVQKAKLIERIAELLTNKKLVLLGDVRDESAEDIRVVLEPKSRSVDPAVLMESLFRATDLESRIGLNLNVVDGGTTPRLMSLPQTLKAFLKHRMEVLERRTRHRLAAIAKRLETLDGYLVAYLNLDEVIRIIREEDAPKPALIAAFALSDAQAEAILNMRLRSLRKLEEMEIKREREKLTKEQKTLDALMASEAKRWTKIKAQIAETKAAFGPGSPYGGRRTEIAAAPAPVAVPVEAVIEREPITVILSKQGWMRSVRGAVDDPAALNFKEGDGLDFLIPCQTTDRVLLVADDGRFFTLPADKPPRGRGYGEPLRLTLDLANDAKLVTTLVVDPAEGPDAAQLLVASDDGRGCRFETASVIAQTRTGRQMLNLEDGAKLAVCRFIPAATDAVAVVGSNRKLLVFALDELPVMGRSRGVILQRYAAKGGLAPELLDDVVAFGLADGLSTATGERNRVFTELEDWRGRRGGAGKKVPTGWPKRRDPFG
ncbi:MAG: DNA topoisomerase (ATP-hydrolyzing), partial [Pseudomonadota bacterium]